MLKALMQEDFALCYNRGELSLLAISGDYDMCIYLASPGYKNALKCN